MISLIGLYSVPEVIGILSDRQARDADNTESSFSGAFKTLRDVLADWLNLVRSSVIGTLVGIVPGAGSSIASFIAYDAAKRSSNTPEKFGHGSEEGLIAAESANNAVTGGSLVPLMTLGIPGNAVTAVLMGGLIIHGLAPGPMLFENTPNVAYGFIFSLFFSNIFFVPVGLIIARYCVRVILLPKEILATAILALATIGAFAIRGQIGDVVMMTGIGFIGYMFSVFGVPRAPMVLGLVLGTMAESNLSRALTLVQGDASALLMQFFTRPFSLALVLLCALSIYFGLRKPKGA